MNILTWVGGSGGRARVARLQAGWVVAFALLLPGCGGGDGGVSITYGPVSSAPNAYAWIQLDGSSLPGTICNSTTVAGTAFISPVWWSCCNGSAQSLTGVSVGWRNETTGQSGSAQQSVQIDLFGGLSNHTWSADVPLVLGSNSLTFTAQDPAGATASQSATVLKTANSYSISGRVLDASGVGLGGVASGAAVDLAGGKVATLALASGPGVGGGSYGASCLAPGSYRVTPTGGPFGMGFTPPYIDFSILNADVSNPDMVANAQRVSGSVRWSITGVPSAGTSVTISQGANQLMGYTDGNGDFNFVVPAGTYRITPAVPGCGSCVFTPAFSDVAVAAAAVAGVYFSRN